MTSENVQSVQNLPKCLIINGPSGVGKGTIISELQKRYPGKFQFVTSHTSRSARQGEDDGVHYHFVDTMVFKQMIKEKRFLEFTNIYDNYYGTSMEAIANISKSKICILDVDEQGIRNAKALGLQGIYVYIAPPSLKELEKRLRGRQSENEKEIQLRMGYATELDPKLYDTVIYNKDLEESIAIIDSLLSKM